MLLDIYGQSLEFTFVKCEYDSVELEIRHESNTGCTIVLYELLSAFLQLMSLLEQIENNQLPSQIKIIEDDVEGSINATFSAKKTTQDNILVAIDHHAIFARFEVDKDWFLYEFNRQVQCFFGDERNFEKDTKTFQACHAVLGKIPQHNSFTRRG